MPNGGRLAIETSNIILDKTYAHTHREMKSGHFAMLSVSDTGIGMSPDVKERIFEPFFTTKEVGKGTGLGLSTVYGIVKQCGGYIWVYSEPNVGTTFKIYLPRADVNPIVVSDQEETESLPLGQETLLLVEDDPLVRNLALRILQHQGYKVLEAANGEEALKVVRERAREKIDLLLTDVVMPKMGGKQLVEELKILRPDMKILYTSGYTNCSIVQHGVLDAGINFLPKPFSSKTLSQKVREALRN
jgi:CheY-like chemotaxis protein